MKEMSLLYAPGQQEKERIQEKPIGKLMLPCPSLPVLLHMTTHEPTIIFCDR